MPWRVLIAGAALFLASCSVKKYAINKVGDALSGTNSTFASDDDPELIRSAVPFSLKLVDSLLAESPRHLGLLLTATRGYMQYSYAFVQEDADEAQDTDPARAAVLRTRATKLYIRARNYGLQGFEVKHPGFAARLKENPQQAVLELKKSEVPLMYWTAMAWIEAISAGRDIAMLPEIPRFEALADRVLSLDESYEEGAIHGFLIIYEMQRFNPKPDRIAIAKAHYERNLALSMGHQAAPLVAYAEHVLVTEKNKAEFENVLHRALKLDPNLWPEHRQLNLAMQRRAQWLLSREDKLFPSA